MAPPTTSGSPGEPRAVDRSPAPGRSPNARSRPGRIVAPRLFASAMTSGPATTSVSLFASATVLPASSAAQVPSRPAAAHDRRQDAVGRGVGHHPRDAIPPLKNLGRRPSEPGGHGFDGCRRGHGDEPGSIRPRLLDQNRALRVRAQTPGSEPGAAVVFDHAQAASTHRTGRTEDHDMLRLNRRHPWMRLPRPATELDWLRTTATIRRRTRNDHPIQSLASQQADASGLGHGFRRRDRTEDTRSAHRERGPRGADNRIDDLEYQLAKERTIRLIRPTGVWLSATERPPFPG